MTTTDRETLSTHLREADRELALSLQRYGDQCMVVAARQRLAAARKLLEPPVIVPVEMTTEEILATEG